MLVMIGFNLFFSPLVPLTDALANTWQKQFPLDYGKVRLWGSVAFVIGSALTGKLVTMFDYRVILALLTLGVASMLLGFLIRPTIQPQGASRQQESTGWSAWLALVRQNWRFLACVCLFHWLRRGFRLCPSFITSHFTPALKSELKRRGIARNFYDDTNLQALVNLCSRRLQKRFETRDIHFLCLYLQYCLLQHHAGITPQFNPLQRRWAESCLEFQVAQEIGRHWQRRALQPVPPDEPLFMALLFSMLRVPDPLRDAHQRDRQLRQSIKRLVNHFRELGLIECWCKLKNKNIRACFPMSVTPVHKH
jgi:hypothetical protein